MNDVRDEALGALLDREASRIESAPVDRLPEVIRRGSRHHAIRLTAIGVGVAVFVGAVSWAGLTWRRDRVRVSADRVTFEASEVPWTFTYPSNWRADATSSTFKQTLVSLTRTTIVNGSLSAQTGMLFSPGDPGSRRFTSEVGDGGVIVLVDRRWSSYEPIPISEYPRGEGTAKDDENPGWAYRWSDRCQGTFCYTVTVWWGPAASDFDLMEAAHIEGSVRLVNEHRWTESGGAGTTLHDEDRGLAITFPGAWKIAEENLTPWLSSPTEILSLGTFPLRVSEDPEDGFRLFDAPVAPAALADMTADDAFVSLQESGGRVSAFIDERPDHFGPLPCEEAIYGCRPSEDPDLPADWRNVPFRGWWIPFRDSERAFYLFVAIGNEATPELREEAWTVADSLVFDPDAG
jgi:hypothetical protein